MIINSEYANYQGSPEQIANRAKRNKIRREAEKLGMVKKGDGKDVDHKQALSMGGGNSVGNIRVVSAHANRSFPRNKDGSMKSNT